MHTLIEEIKSAPESLVKEAYGFFLFLKSRQAAEHGAPPLPSSLVTSAPTAPQKKDVAGLELGREWHADRRDSKLSLEHLNLFRISG